MMPALARFSIGSLPSSTCHSKNVYTSLGCVSHFIDCSKSPSYLQLPSVHQLRKMSLDRFQVSKRLQGTEQNVWDHLHFTRTTPSMPRSPPLDHARRISAKCTNSVAPTRIPMVDVSKLAVENKSLNLGQGFPDFMAPETIVNCLKEVANSDEPQTHQYTRSFGHPRLINALAKLYEPHLKRQVEPTTDILISVGAYGSLFCVIQGLINPGDEVIIIEPFFDCYQPMVTVAGGTPVFVPLRPTKNGKVTSSADWKLDPEELASKFNNKTKLIIVNTPNNPLGKVFTLEELTIIADLCKKHNVVCVADEVYEWLTYDNNKHIKIATLPGMWERTVTIGSAGKTFSVTGWKIGWCVGPKHLVHCAQIVHQNCTYTCPTPTQEAIARGLEIEMSRIGTSQCYLTALSEQLRPKRDNLAKVLAEAGLKPVVPEAGYFMLADFSNLDVDIPKGDESKDFRFVKWLTINKKLTVIPPSAFYCAEHTKMAENYVRFCFIKEDSTLDKMEKILREWRNQSI